MITAMTVSLMVLAAAAGHPSPSGVVQDLLPAPQQIEERTGSFPMNLADLDFVLKAPVQDAADRLGGRLKESQGRLGFDTARYVLECPAKDGFGLVVFAKQGSPAFQPAALPPAAHDEGYELNVSEKGIVVSAMTERGLFYGMMTVEQLINSASARQLPAIPCLHIVDWPRLGMRGFHEDYGRDQLPTIEDHKRTIRTLAQFKMNTHLWFIEADHFVYKFDPEIGKDFDRFTFDEIRELVAYAKQYYVDIIPVVELLAHMENTLNNPKYADLAEVKGSGTICPTSDDSFALIQHIIDEVAPAFDGKYFHCALDESAAVGQGRSAEAVKAKGMERVYADYYTRLHDLLKSHGKTMMMYADIVLNHPKVMDLLPKDIVMMYWDYGDAVHHPGFDTLAHSGFQTTSLSAMWDWVNLYPLYDLAFKNIERLAAQAAEVGALGHFTANWGDGNLGAAGANLSELNYYGVVYTAAETWHPQPIAFDAYSPAFAVQFFDLASNAAAEALTLLAQSQGPGTTGHTKARLMFHSAPIKQIPLLGKATPEELAFWRHLKDTAGKAHVLLKKSYTKRNADYLHSHDLAAQMLEFAADLALQYRATAEALAGPAFHPVQEAEHYQALAKREQDLRTDYFATYAATNRPINLKYLAIAWDQSQKDLDALIKDLQSGNTEALQHSDKK